MSCYLGPYVCCNFEKEKKETIVKSCPNKKCAKFHQKNEWSKFCPDCGSKIEKNSIFYLKSVVDVNFVEKLLRRTLYFPRGDGKWMDNNYHIWIPIYSPESCSRKWFSEEKIETKLEYIPIDNELISSELQLFQDCFNKEIKILMDRYGKNNVKFKWGHIEQEDMED